MEGASRKDDDKEIGAEEASVDRRGSESPVLDIEEAVSVDGHDGLKAEIS